MKLADFIKSFSFIDIGHNHYSSQNVKQKTLDDVPGPFYVPLVGTKWIFYCKYKMSKIHEAYKGRL